MGKLVRSPTVSLRDFLDRRARLNFQHVVVVRRLRLHGPFFCATRNGPDCGKTLGLGPVLSGFLGVWKRGWSPKGKTDPRFFPNVWWRENTDPVPYAREREGKGAKGMGNRTATMIGWK